MKRTRGQQARKGEKREKSVMSAIKSIIFGDANGQCNVDKYGVIVLKL